MCKRHQDSTPPFQCANVLDSTLSNVDEAMEGLLPARTFGDAHWSGTCENGAVMAAVAAHQHPLVRSCFSQSCEMTDHMARRIEDQKGLVSEIVVSSGEWPKRLPKLSRSLQFSKVRVLEN